MTLTLATAQVTHARTPGPTDPHGHHRRAAVELHRSRRRARRRTRTAKLLATLRAAAGPIEIRWREAEPSAAGSGGRVDL